MIFLSAGEASGDLHGAALARTLRSRVPGVRLIGLGGPKMAAEGVELLAGLEELAVMGFVEVLSRLPYFVRLRARVHEALASERVDLVIPIDYPGFNLRLARHAHDEGRAVLYYIAPQVWAWHASRTRDLARDTDRIAVILPFEEEFLRSHGAAAEFVGHPLLDVVDEQAEGDPDAVGTAAGRPLLALMPGSRLQELKRHLPLFSEAAQALRSRLPDLEVRIGAASGVPESAYGSTPFPLVSNAKQLLRNATAAIVKSGTTTLETALAGTPFVVAYRMNPLTYRIARRVVRVPHIALANLVAGRRVVPELVQEEATVQRLVEQIQPLLDPNSSARQEMVAGLSEVRTALGRGGAAARVADMAAELLEIA